MDNSTDAQPQRQINPAYMYGMLRGLEATVGALVLTHPHPAIFESALRPLLATVRANLEALSIPEAALDGLSDYEGQLRLALRGG